MKLHTINGKTLKDALQIIEGCAFNLEFIRRQAGDRFLWHDEKDLVAMALKLEKLTEKYESDYEDLRAQHDPAHGIYTDHLEAL